MARSITTRSTNPKIMDDNIKILDDALADVSNLEASDVSYDNTDSGLTADNVQAAIDEINVKASEALGTVIEEIASGGDYATYALALAELEIAYDALSLDEKRKAVIYSGNAVMPCIHINDKAFSIFQVTASQTVFYSLDLSNHKYMRVILNNSTGVVSYDDLSSNNHAGITLIVK